MISVVMQRMVATHYCTSTGWHGDRNICMLSRHQGQRGTYRVDANCEQAEVEFREDSMLLAHGGLVCRDICSPWLLPDYQQPTSDDLCSWLAMKPSCCTTLSGFSGDEKPLLAVLQQKAIPICGKTL